MNFSVQFIRRTPGRFDADLQTHISRGHSLGFDADLQTYFKARAPYVPPSIPTYVAKERFDGFCVVGVEARNGLFYSLGRKYGAVSEALLTRRSDEWGLGEGKIGIYILKRGFVGGWDYCQKPSFYIVGAEFEDGGFYAASPKIQSNEQARELTLNGGFGLSEGLFLVTKQV